MILDIFGVKVLKYMIFILCKIFLYYRLLITNIQNISEFYFVLLSSITFIIFTLVSVAFLTLLERKKLASIQNRKGPNKVGYFGLLQPIVDGIKLLLKETIIPHNSVFFIFFLSPILAFSFGFIG